MLGGNASLATSIELAEIAEDSSFKTKQQKEEALKQQEEDLRRQLEENPDSRRARLDLAKFLFHQSQFDEAKSFALEVLELDENNPNAYCLLGRILGFGKPPNTEQAAEYFQKALQFDDKYAKAHYFYAYLLRSRLENFEDAEVHYRKAMELRPDDVTSYNDCAIMLVRQKRFDEAKELYHKVLQLQPNHAIAHFNLANLLRKDLKDYENAEKHFLSSLRQRPKFTAALNNYATMLHHQLRRYKEAESYYRKAIQVDPEYARAHFNYANLCREHLKQYAIAQEHYLLAIDYDENNPNFHNNYGLLLQYSLKNYKEARKQYEYALRIDKDHALGHCNYATILMQMVDKKYNKAMEDNLSDDDEKSDYASTFSQVSMETQYSDSRPKPRAFKKITEEKRMKYLGKSEKHFQRSIELNPKLVMAYNNYGCLLRRLKRYDEAIHKFEVAIDIDPKFKMAKRNLQRTKDMMNGKPTNSKSRAHVQNNGHSVNDRATKNNKDDNCIVM